MRSPFAGIRSWFSQVLDLAARLVEAAEGILGRLVALLDLLGSFDRPESTQREPDEHNRMTVLEAKIGDLTLAVSEGVNNVQRSERRVRAVVQSARRELADAGFDHAGVEAEAKQLRELDGEGSDKEEVPAVPEVVVGPERSPIPGVTAKQLRTAYARRH